MIFFILVCIVQGLTVGKCGQNFLGFGYLSSAIEWYIKFKLIDQQAIYHEVETFIKSRGRLRSTKLQLPPHMQSDNFMQKFASLKASFFLSLTEFCLKELSQRTEKERQKSSVEDQEEELIQLARSVEPVQPEAKAVVNQQDSGKAKRKGRPRIKPLFTAYKPKAPTSSYLLFLHENKAKIAAKHNISNFSQVAKAASEEWKQLPESEKERFFKQSEQRKVKYREQLQKYKEKYAAEIREEKKRRQTSYKTKWMQKKKMKQQQETEKQRNAGNESEVTENQSNSNHQAFKTDHAPANKSDNDNDSQLSNSLQI